MRLQFSKFSLILICQLLPLARPVLDCYRTWLFSFLFNRATCRPRGSSSTFISPRPSRLYICHYPRGRRPLLAHFSLSSLVSAALLSTPYSLCNYTTSPLHAVFAAPPHIHIYAAPMPLNTVLTALLPSRFSNSSTLAQKCMLPLCL